MTPPNRRSVATTLKIHASDGRVVHEREVPGGETLDPRELRQIVSEFGGDVDRTASDEIVRIQDEIAVMTTRLHESKSTGSVMTLESNLTTCIGVLKALQAMGRDS